MRIGRRTGDILLAASLTVSAAAFLLPLYVLVVTALKPLEELLGGSMLALPHDWTLEPLRRVWSSACIAATCEGLHAGLLNSVRVAVPAALLSVALGAVNGYALTLWRIPGAHALFALMLGANVIPHQVVLLPVALILRGLGVFGTAEGLILVHIAYGMPYVTLLFRNFYLGVPRPLIQAARLDGGQFWAIFFHLVLPLSRPMLAAALILQFSAIWNDYLFALVFGGKAVPVTVPLNNLINAGLGQPEYDVNMAGVLLTALPPLILYLFAGRFLLQTLTQSGRR